MRDAISQGKRSVSAARAKMAGANIQEGSDTWNKQIALAEKRSAASVSELRQGFTMHELKKEAKKSLGGSAKDPLIYDPDALQQRMRIQATETNLAKSRLGMYGDKNVTAEDEFNQSWGQISKGVKAVNKGKKLLDSIGMTDATVYEHWAAGMFGVKGFQQKTTAAESSLLKAKQAGTGQKAVKAIGIGTESTAMSPWMSAPSDKEKSQTASPNM